MKKCIEIIVSALVVVLGASLPAAAQDATYSCGAYGAGDYSHHDCSPDSGGGGNDDSGTSSGSSDGSGSGGISSGGSSTDGFSGSGNDEDVSAAGDKADSEGELSGGIFSIIFAKLATSWGWVVVFALLLIAGVVLIGWTRRHRRE